jgi:hypothetical protein
MPIRDILESIDHEISQLQRARAMLAGDAVTEAPSTRRGRPAGSKNKTQSPGTQVPKNAAKRTLSAEGKARIAAAQKARWAKQNKAATPGKKGTNKVASVAAKKSAKTPATKVSAKKLPTAKQNATPAKSNPAAEGAGSTSETGQA